ncbi:MAG: 3'-5' exonuclease [Bacteriovoracaceae bacterium]|nr:3'-5' exonuclease [Bacteriovoracaceae bacterium]
MADNTPEELLRSLKFCVIDLETTGGSAEKDQIFEIGMTKIENLSVSEERSFTVNPEREIPEFVQRLTGVKQADVAGAPRFDEIADEVRQFAGDTILVAHNTSFDIPFLNAKLKEAGRETMDNKVLCTNVMTKYMIPEIVNSNLEYMGKIFDLGEQKAHRAVEDARITAKLLLKYLAIFQEKDIRKVNQLYYPRNRFELDRRHFDTSEKTLDDVINVLKKENRPVLITVKGEQGVILSLLPIENPSIEAEDIKKFLSEYQWNLITIRLIGPHFEGLMQLNAHFLKIPEATRLQTLNFLSRNLEKSTEHIELESDDFLVLPHLIQGQLMIYSLMSLASFSHLIFKFPAHRKKVAQFLQNHILRLETQKGKRRHQILNEVRPLIESCLAKMKKDVDGYGLFLSANELKKEQRKFFGRIENLVKVSPDPFHFPSKYL